MSGWTQFDLQHESGVNHAAISMIERGHRKPTKEQKKKLSKAFEIEEWVLFPEEENNGASLANPRRNG